MSFFSAALPSPFQSQIFIAGQLFFSSHSLPPNIFLSIHATQGPAIAITPSFCASLSSYVKAGFPQKCQVFPPQVRAHCFPPLLSPSIFSFLFTSKPGPHMFRCQSPASDKRQGAEEAFPLLPLLSSHMHDYCHAAPAFFLPSQKPTASCLSTAQAMPCCTTKPSIVMLSQRLSHACLFYAFMSTVTLSRGACLPLPPAFFSSLLFSSSHSRLPDAFLSSLRPCLPLELAALRQPSLPSACHLAAIPPAFSSPPLACQLMPFLPSFHTRKHNISQSARLAAFSRLCLLIYASLTPLPPAFSTHGMGSPFLLPCLACLGAGHAFLPRSGNILCIEPPAFPERCLLQAKKVLMDMLAAVNSLMLLPSHWATRHANIN